MNAAFLLMTSAALAGADPAPPPPPPAAPVVVSGAGCNNCAPAYAAGCCEKKPGLLDRIKSRLGGIGKKSHDCGCAPAPAPCATPAPCNTCGGASARPNLFDTLKARWGHKKHSNCGPTCDPCGAAHIAPPVTGGTIGGTTPPKEMPKPKDEKPKDKPKDEKPKGGNTSSVPPIPSVPPIAGAGTSPY